MRLSGTVKAIYFSKGYAFILGEDHVTRFAHASDFFFKKEWDALHEGKAVLFDAVETTRGPRAEKIRLMGTDTELQRMADGIEDEDPRA